jgi:ribonuclease-3
MDSIENIIRYTFNDKDLLKLALTHKSYAKENNERLEFLGDAFLNFCIADILTTTYKKEDEGKLTRYRASLVSREVLNNLGKKMRLQDFIRIGKGEDAIGTSIIGNSLEALIGAIYVDSNYDECKEIVNFIFIEKLSELKTTKDLKDPKSLLQEHMQSLKLNLPIYRNINSSQENEQKLFTVECVVKDLDVLQKGSGLTIKKAEIEAANKVLSKINISYE